VTRTRAFAAGVAVLTLAGCGTGPSSQGAEDAVVRIDGLGALAFPNSGSEGAQTDFVTGVLLLHSFEYDRAAEAFRRAQEIDPDFALAYWGEAMTYTHPVWNEKDVEAAQAALARLAPTPDERLERTPTERERGYIRAVDVLYGEGAKESLDTAYSAAMAGLAAAYPDDLEAQTFHALSILGLSRGDRNVPAYMEAGAIALDAFERNPEHPGAAHYVIHSFDDPTHAILAMEAARAYAPMAPDAGHAQHMTSHIFLARGMWDDVVEANINADGVVDRQAAEAGLPAANCGHYNDWLQYGYVQRGQLSVAAEMQQACFAAAADAAQPEPRRRTATFSSSNMRNWYLADAAQGTGLVATEHPDLDGAPPVVRMSWAWGDGVAAVHRGDLAAARGHLSELEAIRAGSELEWVSPYVPVWRGTLRAWVDLAAGDLGSALSAARAAADHEASLPVDFGPPVAYKPARELEADILLEMGRADEAAAAYRTALGRTPNRIAALAGLARALGSGSPEAAPVLERLRSLLEHADADFPARGLVSD
jgi:tetratricopeptide (TPR) repeat protein